MLKKKILFHLRKVLRYSINGWIAAYCRNDEVLQYMYDRLYKQVSSVYEFVKEVELSESSTYVYDQLYKQVNSVFEYAKMIERYEDRARV